MKTEARAAVAWLWWLPKEKTLGSHQNPEETRHRFSRRGVVLLTP